MPRGIRKPKKTVDERIAEITNEEERLETLLRELAEEKKRLLKQKREEELAELYDLMQEQNLSVSEIRGFLVERQITGESA